MAFKFNSFRQARRHRRRSPQGFTLIELIVSLLVFTFFIGAIATTYLYLNRSLRQASEIRKVYAQARLVLDQVTQDMRLYTLDFECFEGTSGTTEFGECTGISLNGTGQTSTLPLISADGLTRTVYRFDQDRFERLVLLRESVDSVWRPEVGYASGFQPFEMDRVQLTHVYFMVSPLASPYTNLDDAYQFQPSVNVVVHARNESSLLLDSSSMILQTTVSSRLYGTSF